MGWSWGGALAGAGAGAAAGGPWGAVAGGVLGGLATAEDNAQNLANARETRAWQTDLANTAHQREVNDLRAAGLNPILSATGGPGAATPAGATPGPSNLAENASKLASTAIALRSQNKDLEQKDENIKNTMEDTAKKNYEKALTATQFATEKKTQQAKVAKANAEVDGIRLQNETAKSIMPAMIKKAKADGDWAQVNQLMGVIKAGASSAKDVMSIIPTP